MAEVHVQEGETLESALRRFKRKVQQEDIIKEIKKHSFYLKPGERRQTKEALARKRNRKKRSKDIHSPGAPVHETQHSRRVCSVRPCKPGKWDPR